MRFLVVSCCLLSFLVVSYCFLLFLVFSYPLLAFSCYFLELVENPSCNTQQPKTESGMESLTKKKISEEVESIRLEKIDDFRSNLQSRQICFKIAVNDNLPSQ